MVGLEFDRTGQRLFVDAENCSDDTGSATQRFVLAAADLDRVDVKDIRPRNELPPWQRIVTFPLIATSPDGRTAAWTDDADAARLQMAGTTEASKYFHLVDLSAQEVLTKVGNDKQVIRSMAFNPDGHLIAVTGEDNTLRLWDVTDPRTPRRFLQFTAQEQLSGAAVSDDGSFVVAYGATGDAHLWRTEPNQALRALCSRLDPSTLTETWQALGPDHGDAPRCPA